MLQFSGSKGRREEGDCEYANWPLNNGPLGGAKSRTSDSKDDTVRDSLDVSLGAMVEVDDLALQSGCQSRTFFDVAGS